MKKLFLMMLALSLSLSLVACEKKDDFIDGEGMMTEEALEPTLENLFTEVKEDVQPGSAGCSLKAVSVACDFLNYYKDHEDEELDGEKIGISFVELRDKDPEGRDEFNEAWDMVYSSINSLCGEGRGADISEILETAGCLDKGNYPWTDGESIEVFDDMDKVIKSLILD